MSKSIKQILKDKTKKVIRRTSESLEHEVKEGAKSVVKAVTGKESTSDKENLGKKRFEEWTEGLEELSEEEIAAKEAERKRRLAELQQRHRQNIQPSQKSKKEESIFDQINREREELKRQELKDAKKLEKQNLPQSYRRPRGDWRRGAHIKRKQSPELGKIPGQ